MIIPVIPLEPLLKLFDKGIDLLREKERQRKLFFEEVVKPLEVVFEDMYTCHIATFRQTREMLLESRDADEVASFVKGRIIFEQGTTELLVRLTDLDQERDWRHVPSQDRLQQAFTAYVASIARCLISPDYEARTTVGYYLALHDVVRHLSSRGSQGSVQDLEEIVNRFQYFYGDVKAQYAQLQRYSAA